MTERDRIHRITGFVMQSRMQLRELQHSLMCLHRMGAPDAAGQPFHAAVTAALLDIDALEGSMEAITRRMDTYLDHLIAVHTRQEQTS